MVLFVMLTGRAPSGKSRGLCWNFIPGVVGLFLVLGLDAALREIVKAKRI